MILVVSKPSCYKIYFIAWGKQFRKLSSLVDFTELFMIIIVFCG